VCFRSQTTRTNKARKLWTLLGKVPPHKFRDLCYPALKAHCPKVMRGVTLVRDDGKPDEIQLECFHEAARFIPLKRFADVFVPTKACTWIEYE
jgi:hypothetical protein